MVSYYSSSSTFSFNGLALFWLWYILIWKDPICDYMQFFAFFVPASMLPKVVRGKHIVMWNYPA